MTKDPAFLFYSRDFYEGTRTMLPEERACYIDLLIYQHQNGFIPNDIKRVTMYCSGVSEATLIATLEAKFILEDNKWVNPKLKSIVDGREVFSNKQSMNGKIGQFFKKAKMILKNADYLRLKKSLNDLEKHEIYDKIKDIEINEATLEAMLKLCYKHSINNKANANANANANYKDNIGSQISETCYPFENFWNDYDKKLARPDCEKIWAKIPEPERELIKTNLPKYKASLTDKQFQLYPATYLRGRRWLDEIKSPEKPNQSSEHKPISKNRVPL